MQADAPVLMGFSETKWRSINGLVHQKRTAMIYPAFPEELCFPEHGRWVSVPGSLAAKRIHIDAYLAAVKEP